MMIRLQYLWERMRTSYWLLPSWMLLSAALLAWLALYVDSRIGLEVLDGVAWALVVSSEGATAVMSTIAGSMVTIAGVVFSITLVALSLASGQFGPRMLRNFIRDRVNQTALGAFLATFLYCLLVLSAIRHDPLQPFVPHIAVGLGVVLAVISVVTLIIYIHHVAVTIQADTLIEAIYRDLCALMDRLYPEAIGDHAEAPHAAASDQPHRFDRAPTEVLADCHAYVQAIDLAGLVAVAAGNDLVIRLRRSPGQYVLHGSVLMSVWAEQEIEEELRERLRRLVVFGAQRTATQDVEFALDQLVEIASRALSPGINDPFTAITCIDRLASALSLLASRRVPPAWHTDTDGVARVYDSPVSFDKAIDAAFDPIRQYARGNAPVTIRMMEVLAELVPLCRRQRDKQALSRHADMLLRSAVAALPEPHDVADVRSRHRHVAELLHGPPLATTGSGD
ncbi:MAG: DUF2254 domain-containing protein [Rhodocyclaceae bacterium]|nr:DUF2254 domain-containing protein [Rhodocyclaceae bacterium]